MNCNGACPHFCLGVIEVSFVLIPKPIGGRVNSQGFILFESGEDGVPDV